MFQPEQKMGKNQAECRHASKKTGTNNGGFSVSRNGDSGTRLAAGIILPPFLRFKGRVAAVTASFAIFFCKKMTACFFIATRHSELQFELKKSEFRCEIKF